MKIPSEGGWTFESTEIANAFDSHVRTQLPWYDLATGVVAHVVRHYLPENGFLYDIGASTGNISASVKQTISDRNAKVIAIEPSQEMIDIYQGEGEIIKAKAEDVEYKPYDVAVLFLSMMFIPVTERDGLLKRLLKECNAGGCIIIFDKCHAKSGYISTVLSRLTLAGKVATGTGSDDIIKKELSLSGCQRPYEPENGVEIFRFGDFAGWVIEK
tara:strand:- start:278 stop:919 length:642 start_codon:yes stop_codon:yes gene_type:complete